MTCYVFMNVLLFYFVHTDQFFLALQISALQVSITETVVPGSIVTITGTIKIVPTLT